jgi:Fe-S-cluster containining protein
MVPLDEDELERAARLRLPIIETPHRLAFGLPCPRLDGTRCTVYPERPRTCASYACETLRAYGEGEIELAEALARIEAVRAADASVKRADASARAAVVAELARMRRTWFDP